MSRSHVSPACGACKGHPIFARFYDFMSRHTDDEIFGEKRAALLAECRGNVLEIGAGNGNNFKYYPAAAKVTATEPDPYMLKLAEKTAAAAKAQVTLVQADAQQLPFAAGSFDQVVATLVFCTISEPLQSLAEIKRVLRPGGQMRFIEHVQAQTNPRRLLQDLVNPLWRQFTGGCHLNRLTLARFEQAGLRMCKLEVEDKGLLPLIWGVAQV